MKHRPSQPQPADPEGSTEIRVLSRNEPGVCYLVGAGPGDPGLITVRGLACLRRADVVYYDHLVAEELLREAPSGAQRHYVGKEAGHHTVPQDRICAFMCRDVRAGLTVVRLKGGDPFVFGRGAEEALALAQSGLPFEVIPGVTAGVAAPAYAGIPVTHRGTSTCVTFVTGHEAPGKPDDQTDWHALARHAHTLCIYMGVKNLPSIVDRLLEGGRPADEPAAIIERGTSDRQRCVCGTLSDIAAKAEVENVRPPALIVIGATVSLRETLGWFPPKGAAARSEPLEAGAAPAPVRGLP